MLSTSGASATQRSV